MNRRSAAVSTVPIVEPLMKPDEVATLIGMSVRFVQRNRVALGVRYLGSRPRYARADVQAYLDRQKVAAESEQTVAHREPTPIPTRPVLIHKSAVNPITGEAW